MGAGYAITEKQSRALDTALADLLALSEAESVFMSDHGGNLIASCSAEQENDALIQTVAALAAGAFNATRELAALVKEPEFHAIYHQGTNRNIFIQSLPSDFIILIVFGEATPVGLVKLYVERTGREIEALIRDIGRNSSSSAGGPRVTFELRDGNDMFDR